MEAEIDAAAMCRLPPEGLLVLGEGCLEVPARRQHRAVAADDEAAVELGQFLDSLAKVGVMD